jgi:hypothetical protein
MKRRSTSRAEPQEPSRRAGPPSPDEASLDGATLAAWRRAYAERPSAETCPDDEELAGLILDERDVRETGEDPRLEHVIRCPRCAQKMRDLLALDDEARRLSPPRRARPWAVAAGIAVLVAATLTWLLLVPPPGREGGPEVLRGDATTVRPADGATLASPPTELSWPPQTGATGYRVEIRSAAGADVYRSDLRDGTSLTLPTDVVADLEPGAYFWVVEVEGPVARPRLGPFWWTLAPPGPVIPSSRPEARRSSPPNGE